MKQMTKVNDVIGNRRMKRVLKKGDAIVDVLIKIVLSSAVFFAPLSYPIEAMAFNSMNQSEIQDTKNPESLPNGQVVYWCPTNNGSQWTRVAISGSNVVSIRSFKTTFMEEETFIAAQTYRPHQISTKNETDRPHQISTNNKIARPYQISTNNKIARPYQTSIENECQSIDEASGVYVNDTHADRTIRKVTGKTIRKVIFSSSGGDCFHTSGKCPSGRSIYNSNSITFLTEEDAREAGLTKCRRCLFIEITKTEEL